jgi:hypothetical protein
MLFAPTRIAAYSGQTINGTGSAFIIQGVAVNLECLNGTIPR